MDRTVGLGRLRCLHLNDSKVGFGANRDRHENIGAGTIGSDGLSALLGHPDLQGLSAILEVPGAGDGPRAEDIAAARAVWEHGLDMRSGAATRAPGPAKRTPVPAARVPGAASGAKAAKGPTAAAKGAKPAAQGTKAAATRGAAKRTGSPKPTKTVRSAKGTKVARPAKTAKPPAKVAKVAKPPTKTAKVGKARTKVAKVGKAPKVAKVATGTKAAKAATGNQGPHGHPWTCTIGSPRAVEGFTPRSEPKGTDHDHRDPHGDRQHGGDRGPRRPVLGCPDRSLAAPFPDRRRPDARAADPGHRGPEGGVGSGQRRSGQDVAGQGDADHRRGPRGVRRQARRPVPVERLADRAAAPRAT